MDKLEPHTPESTRGSKIRFRLRSLIYATGFLCIFIAAFVHFGSLGSTIASLVLCVACLYDGLRRSFWLLIAGAGFLLAAGIHCILFLLNASR